MFLPKTEAFVSAPLPMVTFLQENTIAGEKRKSRTSTKLNLTPSNMCLPTIVSQQRPQPIRSKLVAAHDLEAHCNLAVLGVQLESRRAHGLAQHVVLAVGKLRGDGSVGDVLNRRSRHRAACQRQEL